MQLNCSIASLNRLHDAITTRALHSNCVYRPVGMTTLIALQGHSAYKASLHMA